MIIKTETLGAVCARQAVISKPLRAMLDLYGTDQLVESHTRSLGAAGSYLVAVVPLLGQCVMEWPSAVSGGLTDARCPNQARTLLDGDALCVRCAEAVAE